MAARISREPRNEAGAGGPVLAQCGSVVKVGEGLNGAGQDLLDNENDAGLDEGEYEEALASHDLDEDKQDAR